MNNKIIKKPEEDPVQLAVYDSSGVRVDEDNIVWINHVDDDTTSSHSFTIKMDPETIQELSDIQYVVETSPFKEPVPSPTPHNIERSSFISSSKCNGRRSHARGNNGSVIYKLVMNDTQKQNNSILAEIVAGYSEYHGAVTLTPRVIFKRKESEIDATTSQGGEL